MMHGYNHGYNQGYAPAYGYGGGVWSSMGTILVLFILLVIISKTMFI
nr:YjcZ family sporulation protein [Paenibacillus sp. JJ-100]